MVARQGLLIVMSAPSGAGKAALLAKLREKEAELASPISATTRPKRKGEVHGRDYYFMTEKAFEQGLAAKHFVEWAEVHGFHYGTLESELERCLATGADVILELDVQGMRSLRALHDDVVTVFLMPPSAQELERRLRRRGTDDDEVIRLRLKNARGEMAARREYDYVIMNDDLDRAAAEMANALRREREKRTDAGA